MIAELSEKELDALVRELFTTLGWRGYHTFNSRRSRSGFPDWTLWRERVLMLELKTATGELTPAQRETIIGLRAARLEVYVIRPADLDALAIVLSGRAPFGEPLSHETAVAMQHLRANTVRDLG